MQTPLDDNVLRHFRNQREKIDGKPARVGRLGTNGEVDVSQDPRVDGNPNRLYAVIGGNRAETAVWNCGKFIVNWRYPGANVRVALNAEGEWEIIAGDARPADRALGRGAGQVLSPPQTIPELNEGYVPGRNLMPGRVRPWVAGTLEVNAERFLYTDTAGDEQEWLPTNANTLDLAGDVPAAISSVNAHRYVKIAFDPDATTPTLVSFAGDAQVITMPLATDGYTDIAITEGFIQLDTVILTTGDADESDIPEADWRYTRRPQGGGAGSIEVDDGTTTVDPTTQLSFDGDYFVVTDGGGGNALVTLAAALLMTVLLNPMTAPGDLIEGSIDGEPARRPAQGRPVSPDPLTADGQLLGRELSDTATIAIGFIGDSITDGDGLSAGQDPPAQVDVALTSSYLAVTISNQAVGGSKTSEWMSGTTNLNTAKSAFASADVRLVHVMLGANDSTVANNVSAATYRANLLDMINDLVGDGYLVALSYPIYGSMTVQDSLIQAYQGAVLSLVNHRTVFLADVQGYDWFANNTGDLQGDGVHPTAGGAVHLAELWAAGLTPIVQALTGVQTQVPISIGDGLDLTAGVLSASNFLPHELYALLLDPDGVPILDVDDNPIYTPTGIEDNGTGSGIDASALHVRFTTANVSSPPTEAELEAALGDPAVVGRVFAGIVNDNNASSALWFCLSDGADWHYTSMTKAV